MSHLRHQNLWDGIRRLGVVLATGLCVLATTGAVQAMDDGGGRSVFAHGAGERALAMGGAFGAIADDASAPLWNPGGLGLVARKELQASHTNLIGMGFSEQFASLVLPSWSLGTGSLTFRRFGVDGIEERDDRNQLLSEDLSDAETELTLGYGYRLGEAWSLGGAVKVQHHSLAGYSGTGLGLDLGVLVRPLLAAGVTSRVGQSLHMGVAVRNLVEPTIRLIEDSVPDPTALRFGLAYEQPLGSMDLLLAGDVDKTRDMDTRLQLGLELQVLRELALRVGSNDGTLTAGAGVRWKDVGVNYTFEDNVLGAVSRIGILVNIGPTVEESRLAEQAAAEAELQKRMNAAFEQDQAMRIENFVAQVNRDLEAGLWDEALAVIEMLKVLEPGDPRLAGLEDAAWRGRGLDQETIGDLPNATLSFSRALAVAPDDSVSARGLRRVRAESQRRAQRSTEIRDLYDSGMDAFVADDLEAAMDNFRQLLELAPGDQDAKAMLGRTEDMLAQLELEKEKAERARRAEESLAAAEMAVADPVVSAAPVVAKRTELTPEERRQIDSLYRNGIEAAESGRTNDAVRYWELVWSSDPDYEQVVEYLKREYLARGMESFAAGNLDAAVLDWERALDVDPDDERAQGYLERAKQQQNRIREITTSRS